MAIKLPDDIKLMASERMDDTDEGGGRMTGNEIIGGQTNNIFPDISRLDRTYGRVSLRKVYAACLSDNQDTYYGAHVIITDPPDDTNVKCWMLTTDSATDRRIDAKNRIESYVIQDGRFIGYLWGDHPAGLSVLRIVMPPNEVDPDVGSVLYLSYQSYSQFVKIISVSSEVKQFTISTGIVTRKILTAEITPDLKYDFAGCDILETTLPSPGVVTDIYKTFGVDRTKYYGVATLTQSASAGDLNVVVDHIFTQIVPVNRAESPLTDVTLSEIRPNSANLIVDDSEQTIPTCTYSVSVNITSGLTLYTGAAISPRTLTVSTSIDSWTDDGRGNLVRNDVTEGYVDYNTGQITFLTPSITGPHTVTVTFKNASKLYKIRFSQSQEVTISTQGSTWIFSLQPLPQPGTVVIDFLSQGRWYRLVDNGKGSLSPEIPGTGGGTVNYTTGSVVATFNALPDIGSEVICYWDNPDERIAFHYHKTDVTHNDMWFEYTTSNKPISKNTVTITWQEDSTTKTLTDDGNGNLTGDGSGTVNYNTGLIRFLPANLVEPNTEFNISYNYGDPIVETFEHPAITEFVRDGGTYRDRDGTQKEKIDYGWIDLVLSEAPIAGTVKVEYDCDYVQGAEYYYDNYVYRRIRDVVDPHITLYDDGNGVLKLASDISAKMNTSGDKSNPNFVDFSIDYANNKVRIGTYLTIYQNVTVSRIYPRGHYRIISYDRTRIDYVDYVIDPEVVTVTVTYYSQTGSTSAQETFSSPLYIDLSGNYFKVRLSTNSTMICMGTLSTPPSSLNLLSDGVAYDYDGILYRLNFSNGEFSQQAIGTINRDKCLAALTVWNSQTGRPDLSLVGEYTIPFYPVYSAVFRIPAPVRPASFILSFYAEGQQYTVTASANGDINDEWIEGKIDYNTGIVRVRFGKWVDKDTFVDAPWYHEDLVDGDLVWQPIPVDAESIKYSAVTYSFIPIDPELIGLDPVKLPIDGRVPIFRPGFVAVVHNTKSEQLPNDLQAGQQIQLSRGNLTYCDLYDYNGIYVDPNLYTVDLENGIITMADPLDLSEYTQPLTAIHRIEDMKVISRVDINGYIYFTSPLKNDYTAGDTYVSSALVCGDLKAQVYNVFDQKTWTGDWSDSRIGDPCTANYNTVDYPITTTNKGAIKERWAIIFTSDTDFKVVGETVGEIAYGNTATDCAPINPATGVPYFYIRHEGWGSGWASGNVLRFNTDAAHYPIWCGRTILPGEAVYDEDSFTLQIRGDAH